MTDTSRVNDELTAIPPARRRQLALALTPLGLVLLLTGVLAVSLEGVGWKLAGLLVVVLAVLVLAVAWGLRRSAAVSEAAEAERRLDEVLTAAAGSAGAMCGEAGAVGAAGVAGSVCGSTGALCGAGSMQGGCAASCLARTR